MFRNEKVFAAYFVLWRNEIPDFISFFSTQNGDRQPSWFWTQNFSLIAEMDARGLNHSENICCFSSNAQSQLVLTKGYFFKMAADGHLEYFKFTFFLSGNLCLLLDNILNSQKIQQTLVFYEKISDSRFFQIFW